MSADLPPDFPELLWSHICEANPEDTERCQYLAQQAASWADGRHPDDLGQVLDAMRDTRVYGVSIELLEAAWNSSATEAFRAQVAQDWVGTVLFGIGDPDGAVTVAEHITKTATSMSAGFLSDFADLLMEWGLLPAAFPILKDLTEKLPGDLSVRYNLATCHKFRGEWAEAKDSFLAVDQHQTAQLPVIHNLLLSAIATGDTELTESALKRIEDATPNLAWHLNKVIQVEMSVSDNGQAEVLYAIRVAPHQARIRGIPQDRSQLDYDDLVLVDYQAQRYGDDAQTVSPTHLYPVLARIEKGAYRTQEVETESPVDARELSSKLTALDVPARQKDKSSIVLIAMSEANRESVRKIVPISGSLGVPSIRDLH